MRSLGKNFDNSLKDTAVNQQTIRNITERLNKNQGCWGALKHDYSNTLFYPEYYGHYFYMSFQ